MPIDYKELENDDDSLRSSTEHSCAAANAVFFFWILSSRSNGALCYVRTRGKTMHFTLGPWRGTPPQGTKLRERDIVRYFGLHHKLYGPQAHKLKTTKSWACNWALLSWALNESAHLSIEAGHLAHMYFLTQYDDPMRPEWVTPNRILWDSVETTRLTLMGISWANCKLLDQPSYRGWLIHRDTCPRGMDPSRSRDRTSSLLKWCIESDRKLSYTKVRWWDNKLHVIDAMLWQSLGIKWLGRGLT